MSQVAKAWRVVWSGMPEAVSIVAARTRGKALAMVLRALTWDAGYTAHWRELRVRRAPEYDRWARSQKEIFGGHCWAEEWVREQVKAIS